MKLNNYILPSSTVRIQLHVSALYVGHLQVEIQLTDRLYKMCGAFVWGLGGWTRSRCFNIGYRDLGLLQVDLSLVVYVVVVYVHILYSWSVSWISTWRWPTYTAETCSCIPTVLLGEIQLCSTVCVIHKNSLLLNQHNGDDAPQITHLDIQGVTGGTDQTSGGCSLC